MSEKSLLNLYDAITDVLTSFYAQPLPVFPTRWQVTECIIKRHGHLKSSLLDSQVGKRLNALVDCGMLQHIVNTENQFYTLGPKGLTIGD